MSMLVIDRHESDSQPGVEHSGGYSLVVGLGVTGLSCVKNLNARARRVVVADTREKPPCLEDLRREHPGVEVHLGPFVSELFTMADEVILSPGVAVASPAVEAAIQAGRPVMGDIELFAQQASAPVIAITGSNGKSTVTTLVYDMIRAAGREAKVGGNLGPDALSLLAGATPQFYVLELSSFQLETTSSLNATAAAVLNLSADHMDRYDSLADYALAKQRIYRGTGVMVVNRDDPTVAAMVQPDRRVVDFSVSPDTAALFTLGRQDGAEWIMRDGAPLLAVSELGVPGRHNVANALAALALVEAVAIPVDKTLDALRQFRGLAHRCELICEVDGVRWVNDSKATNVAASIAAVEGLRDEGPIILIAGGEGKGADFSQFGEVIRSSTQATVLIGRDASRIGASIDGGHTVHYADSMRAAVETAVRLARPGAIVLLSPACASFDMYPSYVARGEDFAGLARELG